MVATRGRSLRDNLIARVCKKLGTETAQLTDNQQAFIAANVDTLLVQGAIGNKELNEIVRKFRSVFVDFAAAKANTAREKRASPMEALKTHTPVPPTRSPDHPRQPRQHNPNAVARENRLVRDQKWADQVNKERESFEQQKQREREDAARKRAEQAQSLEQQISIQRQKKSAEQEQTRVMSNQVIAECQRELAQERAEREAAKVKMMKEREERERLLAEHMDQRKKEHEAKLNEERRYLAEIRQEEVEKKERELARKKQSRDDFKKYIEANMQQERMKHEVRERIRQQENAELERIRRIQHEREIDAQADLKRNSTRGQNHSRRQDAILKRYEETRLQAEEDRRLDAERTARIERERIEREQQEEARRKSRKTQMKSKLINELDEQIHERESRRAHERDAELKFRTTIDAGLTYGATSVTAEKEVEQQRKRDLQAILDAQIREKQVRDRSELQTKIH